MADGVFASLVSATRDANAVTNPIFVRIGDGTNSAPVGGGVEAGALLVTIASDSTGVLSIDDNGGAITVDGAVTVSATALDIRALSEATDQVLIFANTVKDGSGTDYVPLVDADGKLIISNPGGTEYTEDVATPATIVGTATMFERDDVLSTLTPIEGDWSSLRSNARGALWVELDLTNDVTIADGGNTITIDGDIGTVTTLTGITNDVNIADGGNSITVDASQLDIDDLNLTDDAVKVSGNATANSEINPIYTYNVNAAVSGNEVHDYDTAAAVASDATSNHDYTVTGTTFVLKSVIVSGSGNIKFEIQTGPVAGLSTVAVGFLTGRQGDTKQITFDPAIEVPVTSTGTVRIIRTNRQGAATDLYSTIIGSEIA